MHGNHCVRSLAAGCTGHSPADGASAGPAEAARGRCAPNTSGPKAGSDGPLELPSAVGGRRPRAEPVVQEHDGSLEVVEVLGQLPALGAVALAPVRLVLERRQRARNGLGRVVDRFAQTQVLHRLPLPDLPEGLLRHVRCHLALSKRRGTLEPGGLARNARA